MHGYESLISQPNISATRPCQELVSTKNVYVVTAALTLNDFFHLLVETGEDWYIAKVIYSECDHKRYSNHLEAAVMRGSQSMMYSTNQTIIICTVECMARFRALNDLIVNNFNWGDFPMPNDDETNDLHISGIPVDTTLIDAHGFITERITKLIDHDMYTITFPLKTREGEGSVHGYGTMEFKPQVNEYIRRLCKIAINNSRFSTKEGVCRMVSCKWHNKQSYRRRFTQRAGNPNNRGFVNVVRERVDTRSHVRGHRGTYYTPR